MSPRVLVALAIAALVVPTVSATVGTIQPGDIMFSSVGQCTLNFAFDGVGALAGRVYMGTAAHCVSSVGEAVDSTPYRAFGKVAIIGVGPWSKHDWAFIEVEPQFTHLVRAGVKGHPQYPTGVTAFGETTPGDAVQFSGHGMVFSATTPTQERRMGVLTIHEPDRVQVVGPVVFGDSGGPIVHVPSGGALSLQSRLCAAGACTEVGPAFDDVLRQAAARGFTVQLRTV